MEWKRQVETLDILDRIVALLLALADLAERAAGVSVARRRLVLDMMRSGEAATRDAFRAPVSPMAARLALPGQVPQDGPEDALALAASLRALAFVVHAIAAPQRRLASLLAGDAGDRISRGGRHRGRLAFHRRLTATARPPAQIPDTS
ncbi:MAG: hypothetical protein Q8Q62_08535 [Mesorhizobium sp.]|nr:hypothetical protein [Mesorhizobium sp.]